MLVSSFAVLEADDTSTSANGADRKLDAPDRDQRLLA
jgi:hypothetical protein